MEAESHVALLGLKLAMQQGMILTVCPSDLYLSGAGIAGARLSLGLCSAGQSIPASPHQGSTLPTEGQLYLHKGGFLRSGVGVPQPGSHSGRVARARVTEGTKGQNWLGAVAMVTEPIIFASIISSLLGFCCCCCLFILTFQDRISLCSLGHPRTHSVD